MKRHWLWVLTLLTLVTVSGCYGPRNLRSEMEQATALPEGVMQTQFAHLGEVVTPEGTFHVAIQRRVLKGMLAPRGLRPRLLLFDHTPSLVAGFEFDCDSEGPGPLWCEGSRIYFFGLHTVYDVGVDARLIPAEMPSDEAFIPKGNVLDFSSGVHTPTLTWEKRYGSSGGNEDNPWDR